ncbi:MAG: hypothetical protein A2287_00815 [Candidatus Melainabacteria bacterium RIFOXYA12_FULL_32_12]|nr:MAG: hypothetical protein A2255_01485 [Candidatus Melainabacteria bacterium RIFOXYA2_FULL_32_9]OGI24752.1 MAG: hypothetical protein A2287_00815 [Candidatus Melainabacteria bacterium RIFOXYA12_FULL_32_12]
MFQTLISKIFNTSISNTPSNSQNNNEHNSQTTNDLNIFKNIILVIFVLTLGFLAYKVQTILILFFASFVIASAIDPLVELLSRKMPRKAAIFLIALAGLIVIAVFLIPLINIFIRQTLLFLNQAPAYWAKIQNLAGNQTNEVGLVSIVNNLGIRQLVNYIETLNIIPDVSQIITAISGIGQNVISGSVNLTKGFISSVIFIFTSAIIVLYMLIDKYYLKDKFLNLFQEKDRLEVSRIAGLISKKAGGYVISLVIMVFTIGLIISIGLALIGVKFSLILGTIAGILDIIPIVGPIIGVSIIILVSLAQKPILALWAFIIYIAAQWLADTFIRPLIFGKFLNLHPLTLIFSLLVGTILLGFIGIILAPAFAATISVLLDELYIKKLNKKEIIE